jgi:hypothetical protein
VTEERKPPRTHPSRSAQAAAERARRGHPAEDAEQPAAPAVPEDEEAVPDRHVANADAAPVPWPERPDEY